MGRRLGATLSVCVAHSRVSILGELGSSVGDNCRVGVVTNSLATRVHLMGYFGPFGFCSCLAAKSL